MKLLGLDVGTKRIGVAHADSGVRIAVPDGVILADGQEFAKLSNLSRRYNTKWFVIGLPRNNQGAETAQSRYVRAFAEKLARFIPGAKIRFQDESLTSVEAEARLKARRRSGNPQGYEKGEVDQEAAAIILQDFMDGYLSRVAPQKLKPLPAEEILGSYEDAESRPEREANIQKEDLLSSDDLPGHLPDKPVKSKRKAKKGHKLLIISLIVVALIALGCGGFGLWFKISLDPTYPIDDCIGPIDDYELAACTALPVTVETGDTAAEVGDVLAANNLIKNSRAFQLYMEFNYKTGVMPGAYELTRSMSTPEIAKILSEGDPDANVFSFTIFPGDTVSDVKKRLQSIGYSAEEINAAFRQNYDFPMLLSRNLELTDAYGAEPLEGFLYGDTHEFYKTDSVPAILEKFLGQMQDVINENNLEVRYAERGLSLYEGLTLASIVQKEAYEQDQPGVAQVFLKRLSLGMALGSDVTVSYALDLVDPGRVEYRDNADALEVESPYNTRKNAGLPPGPISNPGLSALLSVASPAEADYLFFLTGDDGLMYYSSTEDEHIQNIYSHCQELCGVNL